MAPMRAPICPAPTTVIVLPARLPTAIAIPAFRCLIALKSAADPWCRREARERQIPRARLAWTPRAVVTMRSLSGKPEGMDALPDARTRRLDPANIRREGETALVFAPDGKSHRIVARARASRQRASCAPVRRNASVSFVIAPDSERAGEGPAQRSPRAGPALRRECARHARPREGW